MTIPSESDSRQPRPSHAPTAEPGSTTGTGRLGRRSAQNTRIAVFRALALGDMLCAVPAFRALRAANPDAEIALIGLPWARSFVDRFDRYLDGFVEFPGYPGIPERPFDPPSLARFLVESHERPFDLAIQLQGNGLVSNGFVQLLGARRTAGFYLPAVGCPDPATFAPYPGHGPEIRRHLALMEFLGFPARGEQLEFPIRPADDDAATALMSEHGLEPGAFAVVHPGASIPSRRWPPERFAAVADTLAARGRRVVLTGTAPEREVTAAVGSLMQWPAVDLTGRTEIGAMAALLRRAQLLVSNDTGVAHLADALDVPSVVIFLGSERDRWQSLDRRLHVAVGVGSTVACRNHAGGEHRCLRDACAFPRPDDMIRDVAVDEVRDAALRQLDVAPRARDAA